MVDSTKVMGADEVGKSAMLRERWEVYRRPTSGIEQS